jgi:hypothetical protein
MLLIHKLHLNVLAIVDQNYTCTQQRSPCPFDLELRNELANIDTDNMRTTLLVGWTYFTKLLY